MAETLLALLLVASSAKGSTLVYRWPPSPSSHTRLSRPRYSSHHAGCAQYDNPWRATDPAKSNEQEECGLPADNYTSEEDEYEWKRPEVTRNRSHSFARGSPHPTSGRSSPVKDGAFDLEDPGFSAESEYDSLLGYSSEFLAGMLCPHQALCHQKFELVVDDLAFLGHPVCAESDGVWRFKREGVQTTSRGRGHGTRDRSDPSDERSLSPIMHRSQEEDAPVDKPRLQTFHFVVVLDLPDPSSSAAGNILRYFDIIYDQIAFRVTAVLFQEQVLYNFVETECDRLVALKDEYVTQGKPFADYINRALEVSSVAPAMKIVYESIKTSSIAYVDIHNIVLGLQLPPYLDKLLHSEEDDSSDAVDCDDENENKISTWGSDMSFGWKLPALEPWKALLLLDTSEGLGLLDPEVRGPHMSSEERKLALDLIKLLKMASPRLPLADMAIELDWDVENQLYPIVRWLVYYRRAKVVDVVHEGLKTVFTVPPRFPIRLPQLSDEFRRDFQSSPSIPPLAKILSVVSSSNSKQSDNHFYATVVQSKDLIPIYHEVVEWMLKRELLVALHLRVRVVATLELKLKVKTARQKARARSLRVRRPTKEEDGSPVQLMTDPNVEPLSTSDSPGSNGIWLSLSPKAARRRARRLSSADLGGSALTEEEDELGEEDDATQDEADVEGSELYPSLISDPGRATAIERHWLAAMSEGKDVFIARRFEQINQYFDGKKTDDEILYRAEISRKQLREVLHHYEDYLQTFLHPS